MLVARSRAPEPPESGSGYDSTNRNLTPIPPLELVLTFEQRSRSRLSAILTCGDPIGLALPRGTVLRGGDRLVTDDGRIVAVRAADEDVMDAYCDDAAALTRVAYHLGNRHAAVQIGEGFVRFGADAVLGQMCRRLGARVMTLRAPFEPEAGAYGGGHHAHSGEAKHGGIIHDMIDRGHR